MTVLQKRFPSPPTTSPPEPTLPTAPTTAPTSSPPDKKQRALSQWAKLRKMVVRSGGRIMARIHSGMSKQSWEKHLETQMNQSCVCDPAEGSCKVYEDPATEKLSYWCPVRKEDKEACQKHRVSGLNQTITLLP